MFVGQEPRECQSEICLVAPRRCDRCSPKFLQGDLSSLISATARGTSKRACAAAQRRPPGIDNAFGCVWWPARDEWYGGPARKAEEGP